MQNEQKYSAFSLVELLLVIILVGILAWLGGSAVVNYYRTAVLDADLKSLVNTMREVRQSAISNDSGVDYGVKFLGGQYVSFPGNTYDPANPENKTHTLDTGVIVSTTFTDDILVLNNFTGRAVQAGSVTVTAFGFNKEVYINPLGIVESIN